MYAGHIVEQNDAAGLFRHPRHPYSQGLLGSVLSPTSRAGNLFSIPGSVPGAGDLPRGCRFHPRCPLAVPELCMADAPRMVEHADGGAERCRRAGEAAQAWGRGA